MKFLILVALVGFLLPGEMDAAVTSCYQCTSGQSGCEDTFNAANRPATSCAAGSNFCMKTKVAGTVTSRTCTPVCAAAYTDYKNNISCCNKNNCNAGMMTSFSAIAIMMSLLMAYLTKGRF